MRLRACFAVVFLILLAGCGPVSSTPPSPTAPPPTAPPPSTPAPTPTGPPKPKLQWSAAPAMTINKNKTYTATIATTMGTIAIRLLPKIAPMAVNNFVFLANHGYYTHVPFHRIMKGFMIQTGDPTGTGMGGPGYSFPIEPPKGTFVPGTVAMANTGQPNSNGSQFFICQGSQCSNLNGAPAPGYTIFGKVISGMNVVNKIANVPVTATPANPTEKSSPVHPVYMEHVTIHVGG